MFLLSILASNIYSSDEDGSDFETTRPKKTFKGTVLKESDDESKASSGEASESETGEAAGSDSD